MHRILFITPSKAIGGTNSSLSSIISLMKDRFDVKVLLITSSGTGNYAFINHSFTSNLLDAYYSNYIQLGGKVRIIAIFVKLLKRLCRLFSIDISSKINSIAVRQIERKYKFDIVVGFSEGISMRLASEFHVSKKITWIHCEYDRAVPRSIDELSFYQKFNSIVCVSMYTMDRFVDRYPMLKGKTTYIYNFVDVDRITSFSDQATDDARFKTDLFTIISVGRMDVVKRFSLIPEIAMKLVLSGVQFRWYIIGGPINEEYERIQSMIVDNMVSDNVIMLGGKQNPYSYMKAADLYVSTSLSEACPMVFIEAQLCKLPIMSSNFGSAYEFLEKSKGGRVVNINEMSYELEKIISDVSAYNNLKIASLNASFDNESMKIRLFDLFS